MQKNKTMRRRLGAMALAGALLVGGGVVADVATAPEASATTGYLKNVGRYSVHYYNSHGGAGILSPGWGTGSVNALRVRPNGECLNYRTDGGAVRRVCNYGYLWKTVQLFGSRTDVWH
jgi:hypothetical protein